MSRRLVDQFSALGGLDYIFLTHRDDVADAHKYASRLSAKRIIHEHELRAQPDAEIVLKGESEHEIDRAVIIFTPGHTEGHLVLLWQGRYLFTGDHLAWLPSVGRLGSFNRYCWYSWQEQIRSVAKLAIHENVEWVFPGHGQRRQIPQGSFPLMIRDAVEWMKTLR